MNSRDVDVVVPNWQDPGTSDDEKIEYVRHCRFHLHQSFKTISESLGIGKTNFFEWRRRVNYKEDVDDAAAIALLDDEDEIKLEAQIATINHLRLQLFSWEDIAEFLELSYLQLKWWRMKCNYEDPRPLVSDVELDAALAELQQDHPDIGEIMAWARLEVEGYHVEK